MLTMDHRIIHREYLISIAALNFIFGTAIVSVILNVAHLSLPAILLIALWNIFFNIFSTGFNISIKWENSRIFVFSLALLFFYFVFRISDLSTEKTLLISYNILLPILVLLLFDSRNGENLYLFPLLSKNVFHALINLSVISLFLFFFFKENGQDGRYVLPGLENPIWLGRHFGGLIISLLLFNPRTFSIYGLLGYHFLVICLFIVLLTIQARGPIFATFLLGAYILTRKLVLSPLLKIIGRFVSLILLLVSTYGVYLYLLQGEKLHSMIIRLGLLQKVKIFSLLTFTGNGLGSWGPIVLGIDKRAYPHNMIVEILFEFGLLGFVLLSIWLWTFLKYSYNSLFYYLGIYFFIGAMVSGDIPGNNYFFISTVVVILTAKLHK